MRTSNDEYKLPNGEIVSINQMTKPPQGAIIQNGYDYEKQCWIHNGRKDTRTPKQLQASIDRSMSSLKESAERIGAKESTK